MDIVFVVLQCYFIKVFDFSKKLIVEEVDKIKILLQYSFFSINFQLWYFIVVSMEEGKVCVVKFVVGNYMFNECKMLDVFYVVVFCVKIVMDDVWFECVVNQEDVDGCFVMLEVKVVNDKGCCFFVDMYCVLLKDDYQWMVKQVYLNVGNFLLGVVVMGFDVVFIEGFDVEVFDVEFGLKEKGYISLVVVLVGYYSVEDFNVGLLKLCLLFEIILMEV